VPDKFICIFICIFFYNSEYKKVQRRNIKNKKVALYKSTYISKNCVDIYKKVEKKVCLMKFNPSRIQERACINWVIKPTALVFEFYVIGTRLRSQSQRAAQCHILVSPRKTVFPSHSFVF